MSIELVATPGASNADSYATVEEAQEYAAKRVGGAAFLALEDDEQAQALFTGTALIDTLEGDPGFIGSRTSSDQALAFPRDGDTTLPPNLVKATIELAISYTPAFAAGYTGDPLSAASGNGNIQSETVGPLSTTYFEPQGGASIESLPVPVQRFLSGLLVSDAPAWGSAVVTRGS